jgi:hypothetical protein
MNKSILISTFIVSFALMSSASLAQPTANFSGTWAFDTTKSDRGPGGYFLQADQILRITQNSASITFAKTVPISSGNFTSTDKYFFDGKTRTQKKDYGTDKISLQWSADKKVLTITTITTAETKNGPDDFLVAESWKLSDDGRTLMNESYSQSKQLGKTTIVTVYKKK